MVLLKSIVYLHVKWLRYCCEFELRFVIRELEWFVILFYGNHYHHTWWLDTQYNQPTSTTKRYPYTYYSTVTLQYTTTLPFPTYYNNKEPRLTSILILSHTTTPPQISTFNWQLPTTLLPSCTTYHTTLTSLTNTTQHPIKSLKQGTQPTSSPLPCHQH